MNATVVEVDVINYSETAFRVERELGLGAEGLDLLNGQLRALVARAVKAAKLDPKKTIKHQSADGFVLSFLSADDAHHFSVKLHKLCIAENRLSTTTSAHRWFRIGAATGELYEGSRGIAGLLIIEAVRLEAGANKGHILIDEKTYKDLSLVCRNEYIEKLEPVIDKKDKVHFAYRCEVPVPEEPRAGIVSPEQLEASDRRMSDEVFAIELLNQPVTLERDENGSVMVTVDRRKVKEMLISNEAKLATTVQYVTHRKKMKLLRLDRDVQTFLAGGSPEKTMCLDLPQLDIRLRWASGGVLSIVTDTDGKQWVPLFFRDIRPYGWNIALGTTERWFQTSGLVDRSYNLYRDLNSPNEFILREFLEESIVVNPHPQTKGTLVHKHFSFSFPHSESLAVSRAKEFYKKHSDAREDEGDELKIEEESRPTIKVRFENAKCSLKVLSDSGPIETSGLLVCFSLLDLGIEVVRVAKYNFDEGDWMLDGEIREKHVAETRKTDTKLIRMPVAMLSLDYLRKTFGSRKNWHRYTFGPQPSIKIARPPDLLKEEIRYFDWDVKRRMKVVEGEWGDEWHRGRFIDWYDKFGSHFIKDRKSPEDEWQLSYKNPSRLFVPATAKILDLYFSLVEGKEKND
jgi:hypothetical protein